MGRDVRRFVRSMRGIRNSMPCTVWYAPIATSGDGQKCPPCAEVCYDRVSILTGSLWTYRSQLSNRQGYPETGLPLAAENSATNLSPASGERPYSKISEIAIGGAKMFYQSLLKNVRRTSILYFRHKWRCVWQTLWLESKSAHNSVVFHDANGYAQKWWK